MSTRQKTDNFGVVLPGQLISLVLKYCQWKKLSNISQDSECFQTFNVCVGLFSDDSLHIYCWVW